MVDNNEIIPQEDVPRKIKLNFSIGSLASDLLNSLVFGNLTFYYQIKLGVDAQLLLIGWIIFAIWNTVNDPLFSYLIDNTRTKIGRRIPYIRYGSIFYGLAFIFCWFPIFPLGDQIGLFINFLLALFILDTMFTIIGCCYFALPNEIAVTAKQRASLGVYRSIVGFINIVLGLVLPIILLTGQSGTHPLFVPIILIIGFGASAILFLTSFGIKENMFAQLQPHEGFIEGLKLTLKNKPFWIFMIPAFIIATVLPIFSTGLLYYIDYVISGQSPLSLVLFFLSGIIAGMLINIKKIEKWQPKKTMIINLSIASIGSLSLFILGYSALFASISFFLIGTGFAGGSIANIVLMGDVIDNDELITGKRREAIYGGVNAIITKPSLSIGNSLFLWIIQVFSFKPPIIIGGVDVKQPQEFIAIVGILFAFCVVPAILLIFAAIALKWYPLDGPEWLKKKKYILDLHEKKEKEYLMSLRDQKEK
ncbi:MAG: MFS transporter [Promethearchaeota archaeon]